MVAHVPGECMKMPLVPLAAVFLGGVSALAVLALPARALEAVAFGGDGMRGFARAVPFLADTARPVSVIATGAIVVATCFLVARLCRRRGFAVALLELDMLPPPMIRRADSHPDADPRLPLRATHELDGPGQPEATPEQAAERDLPADLDQPLAAYDPQAIPSVPLPPPVPPRRERAANAGQRTLSGRDPADRLVRPETDATVHALLERLERGVVRRNQVSQVRGRVRTDRGLDDALAALRSLARHA